MGDVVDVSEAESTGCTCYQTEEAPEPNPRKYPDAFMCYSKGVRGTLSDGEDSRFCGKEDTLIIPKSFTEETELGEHIEKFEKLGEISDKCLSEGVSNEDFYSCIEKEAGKLS